MTPTRPTCSYTGRLVHDYIRHDGPEHVLCFAPTRSGKGVGLVIPTLLTWAGSVIVHDIKGENHGLTAGWRARFLPHRRRGRERYDGFVETLRRRLAKVKSLADEISQDIAPT